MPIDTEWFHLQLERRGETVRGLARFMRIDASAASRMLRGERKMSADEQDQVAAFLGLSLEDVAQHRRVKPDGFGEGKQKEYAVGSLAGSPVETEGRMVTQADIVWRDDRRFIEAGDGELVELHPAFGCMKGAMTIPDNLDLTAPADADWGKVYEDE
jgi:transcriptional regulator with XRE-family HTH domain